VSVVVLGIGNLLFADEGFGVRCVEELHRRWEVRGVELLDGGTQGLYLVQHIAGAEHLLVFDCLDWGDPPGTLRVLRQGEVPSVYATGKLSLHQAGFWDVLAAADLLGKPPREVVVVGVQAADLEDWGGALTAPVAAQLEPALRAGIAELEKWGVVVLPRAEPLAAGAGLLAPGLDRASYERTGGSA
jgi:hydrogenase maturation protease